MKPCQVDWRKLVFQEKIIEFLKELNWFLYSQNVKQLNFRVDCHLFYTMYLRFKVSSDILL